DPRSPSGHTPARVGRALLRGDQPGARVSEGDGDEPSALRAPPAPAASAGAPVSAERVMTCAEVEGLLDAFVDAELPAPALLAVARHAGGCEAEAGGDRAHRLERPLRAPPRPQVRHDAHHGE